jgi:adenylate cyclase
VAPGRVAAFAILALLVLVRVIDPSVLETSRLRGFDLEQQIAPRIYEPLPVAIVAVDGKSLSKYGQWPWPRTLVARLVDQVAAGRPRVLGVDIIFSEPDRLSPPRVAEAWPDIPPSLAHQLASLPTNETALADAFRKVPTVLGVGVNREPVPGPPAPVRFTMVRESGSNPRPYLIAYPRLLTSLPEITAAERGRGGLFGQPDADGIFRRVPLFVVGQGHLVPALALEMLRVAGAGPLEIVTAPGGVRGAKLGNFFIPTDRNARAYPHYSPAYELRYISAADLLDKSFDPAKLRNDIVLLGLFAQGLADDLQTPLGLTAGVEIHAQLIESILTGSLLLRPAILDPFEITVTIAAALMTIFVVPYRRPRIAYVCLAGLVALILVVAFESFHLFNLLLDAVYPVFALVVTFGVMQAANLRAAEIARRALAAELAREREVKVRLEGELTAARAIQMGLLPHRFVGAPERRDVDTYASIEPARMVGGDLYDFLMLDSNRMSFAIADVSGKGVPAALFMAMTKELLRGAALRYGDDLDRVFAEANAKICAASDDLAEEGTNMMFVTVFAGVLDLASGLLVYVNAGHDSPFVLRAGAEPLLLTGEGGPPLGTVDHFPYPLERRQLLAGDLLLLYTDGVTEAQNADCALYGTSRLERLLTSAPTASARSLVDFVREDVRRFVAGAEQTDDITLLALRWLGAEDPST